MPSGDGPERPRRHLLVFGKAPEAGRTKTRLAPALGERGAAILYGAFLDDLVGRTRSVPAERRELWAPRRPGAARKLAARFPDLVLRWQRGEDLGERLADAFLRAFDEGADRVLIVGSDHPTLPSSHLRSGLDALESADVVLGPTEDGGYYAIGLRRSARLAAPDLFVGLPWSTSEVRDRTLCRAEARGLATAELPAWYDVDDLEDLARLRSDLAPGSATARTLLRLGVGVG